VSFCFSFSLFYFRVPWRRRHLHFGLILLCFSLGPYWPPFSNPLDRPPSPAPLGTQFSLATCCQEFSLLVFDLDSATFGEVEQVEKQQKRQKQQHPEPRYNIKLIV